MRAEKIWWNGINGIHIKLALKISGLKWDAAIISNIGVDDLDHESFDIFRREALQSGCMLPFGWTVETQRW